MAIGSAQDRSMIAKVRGIVQAGRYFHISSKKHIDARIISSRSLRKIQTKGRAVAQRLDAGFPPRRPGFAYGQLVEFVVDKAALWQVFSEYFGFPCQSFHRFLHYHNHPGLTQQTIKWPQCREDLDSTPHYAKKKKDPNKVKFEGVFREWYKFGIEIIFHFDVEDTRKYDCYILTNSP
jgi:hypothetical protein